MVTACGCWVGGRNREEACFWIWLSCLNTFTMGREQKVTNQRQVIIVCPSLSRTLGKEGALKSDHVRFSWVFQMTRHVCYWSLTLGLHHTWAFLYLLLYVWSLHLAVHHFCIMDKNHPILIVLISLLFIIRRYSRMDMSANRELGWWRALSSVASEVFLLQCLLLWKHSSQSTSFWYYTLRVCNIKICSSLGNTGSMGLLLGVCFSLLCHLCLVTSQTPVTSSDWGDIKEWFSHSSIYCQSLPPRLAGSQPVGYDSLHPISNTQHIKNLYYNS